MTDNEKVLERMLQRERQARKQAEKILEQKSKELFDLNLKLKEKNEQLSKKVGESLKEIEQVARFPRENPYPVVRFNKNLQVIYSNDAGERLLKKLKSYPQQNYNLLIALERVKYKDTSVSITIELLHEYYKLTLVSVKDKEDINVYGADVTETKLIQEDLLLSESRLQAFLDSVPDMIFRISEKGIFLDLKPGITPTLTPSKSPEEIKGTSINDTKLDQAVKRRLFLAVQETISTGKANVQEYDYKNGEVEYFFEARIVRSGQDEAVVTVRDITSKKMADIELENQKRFYESILNSMPSDLVVFDSDHRYKFVNPQAVKDPETRRWLINKTDFDYCKRKNIPESIARARRALFDKVKENKMNFAMEEKVVNSDGGEEWHYRRMMPIVWNTHKKAQFILGYGLDITELKKTQFELEEAKEIAEKSVESKQQFLANMSHEIRTPMNAILGMAKLMSQTGLTGKQMEYLKAITDSSDHLLTVINDILDFSKIDSGKIELDEAQFNLKEMVTSTISSLDLKAKENENILSLEFAQGIHESVNGDQFRIKQIFINLLNNAIKFTKKGKIILSCSLVDVDENVQKILFKVSDTGIGIDPDKLETIFESFSQEDGSITRKYGGTGLGLTISKNLVRLMGGDLMVNSTKGFGTQFFFELSMKKELGEALKEKEFKAQEYDFSDVRLLIAEDNQFNQLFISEILNQYGFHFTLVSNGEEAVMAARREEFDIVFLDIQMPLMSGLEACQIMKNEIKVTYPLIALTANALKGDREHFLSQGFDNYMSKPFSETQFLQIVANQLGLVETDIMMSKEEKQINVSSDNQNKLYDLEKLLRMTNGDDGFANKMLTDFCRLTPDLLRTLGGFLEDNNAEGVRETAHKMKSSYGIMADRVLYDKLVTIEGSLKKNESLGNLKSQIKQVISMSNVMLQQIEADHLQSQK